MQGQYLTYLLTDKVEEFLEDQREESEPFFLYAAYNTPHTPAQAPEALLQKYAHIPDPKRRVYVAMVDALDQGVGDILQKLTDIGKRDNTLVFFLSDNGGSTGNPHVVPDNTPFRGQKGNLFEGGIHVPFVAQWPARWPVGSTYEPQVISLDIGATALALAGITPDPELPLDGVNLDPFVLGTAEGVPHEVLFWRRWQEDIPRTILAARSNTRKLYQDNDELAYFDLTTDIGEQNNLAHKLELRSEMQDLVNKWNAWNAANLPLMFPLDSIYYPMWHERKEDGLDPNELVPEFWKARANSRPHQFRLPDLVGAAPSVLTVSEASGTAPYTVQLAAQPTGNVTVTPRPAGPVTVRPRTVLFTPDNWNTAQTVTVRGINDTIDNPGNQWTATITHIARGGGFNETAIATVTVTVLDNDAPRRGTGGGGGGGGGGGSDGTDSDAAFFGVPPAGSAQSSVGLLSGWACNAERVEIELIPETGAPQRVEAAYGTERLDTADECGDTNNGFGLLYNWNRLGDGEHEVVVRIDGVVRSRRTITVTTLGQEFRRGLERTAVLTDFPRAGESVTIQWQEARQHFVIISGEAPDGTQDTGNGHPEYVVENPPVGSFQSGIGLVSGWACEAEMVEVEFLPEAGESWRTAAGYGTDRPDTADVCGDTNNGFGLLHNWNRLGDGTHEVVVRIDGEEVGRRTITVTTLGESFAEGLSGTYTLTDFPEAGENVTLEWQEAQQNFVITDWTGAE